MGQQGAGQTATWNDPPACPPNPSQTQRAASPRADTKSGAPRMQTAAEPYGGTPHRVKDYRCTEHANTRSSHTIYTHAYVCTQFHRNRATGVATGAFSTERGRSQKLEGGSRQLLNTGLTTACKAARLSATRRRGLCATRPWRL